MQKMYLSLILLVLSLHFVFAIQIDSCQTISSPGNYELTLDLNYDGKEACIRIESSDVLLDGNTYSISGNGKNTGIEVDGQENVVLTNLWIQDFNKGIKLIATPNSEVSQSIFHSNNQGLSITTGKQNTIVNNEFHHNEKALILDNTEENSIHNNIFNDNSLGIKLSSSHSNKIENNELSSNIESFHFTSSTENKIKSSSFDSLIVLESGSNGNTFLDSLYDSSLEDVGAGSKLMRKWSLDLLILDQFFSPVDNAEITVWNGNGDLVYHDLSSNDEGKVNLELTEYINNGRRRIRYNPYIISAAKNNYQSNSETIDINSISSLVITLMNQEIPEVNLLSNIQTYPNLPLLTSGNQNIEVTFDSAYLPLNATLSLLDSNLSLVQSVTSSFNNSTVLSILLTIPSDLEDGDYYLVLNAFNDQYSNKYPLGLVYIKDIADNIPLIIDLVTFPSLPSSNIHPGENITVDFTTSEGDINISLYLYKDDLLISSSFYSIQGNNGLPLVYTIPDVSSGNYELRMSVSDLLGHVNSVSLGTLSILQETQPGPSGSGSGSGGGGGSRSRSINTNQSLNITNQSIQSSNITNVSKSPPNNNESTNQTATPRGTSAITGAVIGTLKSEKFWIILTFIALIIIAYYFVRKKVKFI